jgi:predicted glycogen debranching enzyme
MDAKVGDYVVTPRIGCPVEINALWFNALSVYVSFGNLLGFPVSGYVQKLKDLKSVFRSHFINEKGYLNDVVIPGHKADETIRPNQVYAISLPFSPLTNTEAKRVLDVVHQHLYTEYGLRSLRSIFIRKTDSMQSLRILMEAFPDQGKDVSSRPGL